MAKLRSQGTTIWRLDSTASPNAYEQIGQVISIAGPTGSAGEIDVSDLSSVAREFISSLPDWGNVSLGVVFDPATASVLHAKLWDDFIAGTIATYQIRLTNSPQTKLTFPAFPNEFPIDIAVDDMIGATITLRTTDAVVKT